jgi:hypothetical protein
MLKMECKLSLAGVGVVTLWTRYGEGAALVMLIELGLALEDALATYALEVILLEMVV